MSVAIKEFAPVSAQKQRPITRLYVLEAIFAAGFCNYGRFIKPYLRARADFCSAHAANANRADRRALLNAAKVNKRISKGSELEINAFCRDMITEASRHRRALLEQSRTSDYPPEKTYLNERVKIVEWLAIGWIKTRTNMDTPTPPGTQISLLELLSIRPSH